MSHLIKVGYTSDIPRLVPKNESIVTSAHERNMVYFITNKLLIPYTVSSQRSLVSYMVHKNLTYVLVYENQSTVIELTRLFNQDG